jgi:thiosulfate/3-mercaptopyruvate sulfurtransferase
MNRMKPLQLLFRLWLIVLANWGYGIQTSLSAEWPNPQFIVETDWLGFNLQDPNLAILHVASQRRIYDRGHIPGAVFIHYPEIVKQTKQGWNEVPAPAELSRFLQEAGIHRDSRVVICYETIPWVGPLADATRLFWVLEYLGHEKMAILNGGIEKWLSEKRGITTDLPARPKGNFQPPRIHSQILTDRAGMKERLGKKGVIILDTRSDMEYLGLSIRQPAPARAGHIPGAKLFQWIYYFQEYPGGGWGIRSMKEIEEIHRAMGIQRGHEIILYCNSGHLCTANYWVLRLMGFANVRVYIGSMAEWRHDSEAPVTKYKFE